MPAWLIIAFIIIDLLAMPLIPCAAETRAGSVNSALARDEQPHRLTILSIIPSQGEPETSVTLSGSGFTSGTTAYLGNNATPTTVIGPKQLNFEIPDLAPGLYALFLRDTDGTTSRTYNFSILPPKPVIFSLSPDTIQACAPDKDRQVVISGQNFQVSSQAIFDGAAIKGNFNSRESFSINVPRVAAGLHQVQIKNPGDAMSGAQGLFIDARPEIDSVTTADDYVNYYNLVIGGRNFQQDSTLVVTEERDMDQSGNQRSDVDVKRLRTGTTNAFERDRVIFVNCGQLIYQRYPYSTVLKNFKVQVVNSAGEESSVIQVSAP
jgi:hypothetical protein